MRHFPPLKADTMRFLIILLLSAVSAAAFAAKPVLDNLEPPPPPPAIDMTTGSDVDDEAPVTIIKQSEQTVEEYRVGGKLYMIKVIPKHGVPYYLVDERGDGKFARQESLDSGFRPPRWVIKRF